METPPWKLRRQALRSLSAQGVSDRALGRILKLVSERPDLIGAIGAAPSYSTINRAKVNDLLEAIGVETIMLVLTQGKPFTWTTVTPQRIIPDVAMECEYFASALVDL